MSLVVGFPGSGAGPCACASLWLWEQKEKISNLSFIELKQFLIWSCPAMILAQKACLPETEESQKDEWGEKVTRRKVIGFTPHLKRDRAGVCVSCGTSSCRRWTKSTRAAEETCSRRQVAQHAGGKPPAHQRARTGGGTARTCFRVTRDCAERDREALCSSCTVNSLSLWCCTQIPSQAGENTCQGDKHFMLSHLYCDNTLRQTVLQMNCQSPMLLWCKRPGPAVFVCINNPHLGGARLGASSGSGAPRARVENLGHRSWGHSPTKDSLCFSASNHMRTKPLVSL